MCTIYLDAINFGFGNSCSCIRLRISFRCNTQSTMGLVETSSQQSLYHRRRTSSVVFYRIVFFCISILMSKHSSRGIWEGNLKLVQQHNLEADMGIHTYWLGMNRFADLVSHDNLISYRIIELILLINRQLVNSSKP